MKPVSDQIFAFDGTSGPAITHERCSAQDLGLKESWFRDAIFESPELVIGACRAAGLTDDEWYGWCKEFETDVGQVDVLLVSSQGRLGVVETKLASNPELRRKVLAQVLDYLAHLPAVFPDPSMPPVPKDENGNPVAGTDDIQDAISRGDVLIIIASDECDPRVAKLSYNLLADHLVKQWDLVLVDLALYRPRYGTAGKCVIVSNVRNLVQSEPRQVVRVVVQGENPKARVEVTRIIDEPPIGPQKWDEKRFFERLATGRTPAPVRELAAKLLELASRFPDSLSLDWGRGQNGSMVVKRHGAGLIEVFGGGNVRFRPSNFDRALGASSGGHYREALERLVPRAMSMKYPFVSADEADRVAPALFELVRDMLEDAESTHNVSNVER